MTPHSAVLLSPAEIAKIPVNGFAQTHMLVVGDVMLDRYILGDVSRISPEAPVPVLAV
jgi:D-beta-D-heptose 7-phosphate kinase / D-beta-D-heptose 1-phosphate adenosyltransferase